MAKNFYLPGTDDAKAIWLNNFASKLSNHAATLRISNDMITSVQNDANMYNLCPFPQLLVFQKVCRNYTLKSLKNLCKLFGYQQQTET